MEQDDTSSGSPQVNPGYAGFQLAKAFTTSNEHKDPATRERAQQKILKWLKALRGLLSGQIEVGSRAPVKEIPAWAMLEVLKGGFATGNLHAGGLLLPHERELLKNLDVPASAEPRGVLNTWCLSEEGLRQMRQQLLSRRYDVNVPEEGALLAITWLADNNHTDATQQIIDTLAPFFDRLRFYPVPSNRARTYGSKVFVQTVSDSIEQLKSLKPQTRLLVQQETVQVWTPIYDRMVSLFLETVTGTLPDLRRGNEGKPLPPEKGRFAVEGGWPCQIYPQGWQQRARVLLEEIELAGKQHKLSTMPRRAHDSFALLRDYLARCVADPRQLNGRDVGKIRLILAGSLAKRGTPDSDACRMHRSRQLADVSALSFRDIANALIARLQEYPAEEGIEDVDNIMRPLIQAEAAGAKLPVARPLPPSLQRKIGRALCADVNDLIHRGVITSGEALARVLPQLTAGLCSAGFKDSTVQHLYASIYHAFRRRRSLLLLNLESQIKIDELPWVAALNRFRRSDASAQTTCRNALQDITLLTLTAFPHAIIPNKLLQELRALARGAELDLPLLDELAADIFMGQFSSKFVAAAHIAADVLQGTLYQNYFGIDFATVRRLPILKEVKGVARPPASQDQFAQLCTDRAGVGSTGGVARNGMVIEHQQILTSQNLAVLLSGLGITERLADHLPVMAKRCFTWICRRQQMKIIKGHAGLIMLKNTAYAWRQMIFYLSFISKEQLNEFLSWAETHLRAQREPFQSRFRPAFIGLILAAQGISLDDPSAQSQGAQRFLGWSTQKHWLFPSW
jgi:hypothetical protein